MNKIIISGRLTRDVEIKNTTNGAKVANISVAVRRNFKNQDGEYESDFFNCSAFGATADILEKYFQKGKEILISGNLRNRSWDDAEGKKHYATDIIIETVDFIGSKSEKTDDNNSVEMHNPVNNNSDDDLLPF